MDAGFDGAGAGAESLAGAMAPTCAPKPTKVCLASFCGAGTRVLVGCSSCEDFGGGAKLRATAECWASAANDCTSAVSSGAMMLVSAGCSTRCTWPVPRVARSNTARACTPSKGSWPGTSGSATAPTTSPSVTSTVMR